MFRTMSRHVIREHSSVVLTYVGVDVRSVLSVFLSQLGDQISVHGFKVVILQDFVATHWQWFKYEVLNNVAKMQ